MDTKERKIVEAAIETISRYGMRRTTMGDIAEKAGISRQTLYSKCANKNEVLAKVVKFLADTTLAKIKADWEETLTITEKLDVYFEHAVINHYEMLQTMPDSGDLIAGLGNLDSEEIKLAEKTMLEVLATQFKPYAVQLKLAGSNPKELADFVQSSSRNFKYVAEDRKHLQRLLNSLKGAVLALICEQI